MSSAVEICPLAEDDRFLSDWTALLARAGKVGFFQSEAWVSTFLARARAEKAQLFTVRAEAGGVPVLMGTIGVSRPGPVPLLYPVEARLSESGIAGLDAVYVEYNDFLVAEDAPDDVRVSAWDAVFDKITADSYLIRNATGTAETALASAADARGWPCRAVTRSRSFVTDLKALRAEGGDVLSSLSKNSRKQVERSMRLYEERGPLRLDAVEGDAAWPDLHRLHEAAWTARGQGGVFANRRLVNFHAALRRDHPQAVEFLELRAGEDLIGSLYNFRHGGTVSNYQSGFAYEADNRLKPGLVAHVMAAQRALDAGLDCYDMLVGEMRYKSSLGREHETMSLMEVVRPGLAASVRGVAKSLRSLVRR